MNADTLRQIIANCRRKHMRFLGFPCDWYPAGIKRPDLEGYFFTDASAWELIADKLEEAHPFEELILDNPKGALAIVMHIRLVINAPSLLYVKVEVGVGNKAIGRSFHYSDHYKH